MKALCAPEDSLLQVDVILNDGLPLRGQHDCAAQDGVLGRPVRCGADCQQRLPREVLSRRGALKRSRAVTREGEEDRQ